MNKILFFTSLLFCSVAITSCKDDSAQKKTQSRQSVRCFRVTQTAVTSDHSFPFITQPYRTSDLSFRVGGVIDRLDVQPGNYYRKGELIGSIDPRDYKIRLTRCEAVYKQAEAEYKRIETLYKSNNIAASTYEKARAEYTTALTAFQTAENELQDTRLIAPFNGYIQTVYIERFQDVKATQPIISFIDIDQIKIEAYVPQSVATQISKGDQIQTFLDAEPEKSYFATVSDVSKSTTQNNLSYLLTATLDNKSEQLPAGVSGKLQFSPSGSTSKNTIIIPQTAIRNRSKGGSYVWVIDPKTSKTEMRTVKIGTLLKEGIVSITEGLSANELIATTGIDFLTPNSTVNIISHEN